MGFAQFPTDKECIDYLVLRRYPLAKFLNHAPSLSSRSASPQIGQADRKRIESYRDELTALTPDELARSVIGERAKEAEEARLRADAEERSRFFNQPHANADYQHWSKAAHWTLDEAIALSFGKAPERVMWERVKPFTEVSPFAAQYARRRDLTLRAVPWEQLFDPVLPSIFLAWCKRLDLPVPAELTAAMEACGVQVADWKKLYEESQASWEENYGQLKRLFERSQADATENHARWLDLSGRKDQLIASLKERTGLPPVWMTPA